GSGTSSAEWRERMRGWGTETLRQAMPERESGLASALLLGEGSLLPRPEWDRYKRTGVIHVLVVSGQQLVILGIFLSYVLRVLPLRKRQGVLLIVLFLWSYALVAGGR